MLVSLSKLEGRKERDNDWLDLGSQAWMLYSVADREKTEKLRQREKLQAGSGVD